MTAAVESELRRHELARFLRSRRERITPEQVGLPIVGRRRTPGLRREEVALLAGVGTTWYTWLEQGRDVRASLEVLEAVARALRLTPAERAHVILLGRGEHAPPCKAPAEEVSPTLRRLVANLGPGPAYLLSRTNDVLAASPEALNLFAGLADWPERQRNTIRYLFLHPTARDLFVFWERAARSSLAKLRAVEVPLEQIVEKLPGTHPADHGKD